MINESALGLAISPGLSLQDWQELGSRLSTVSPGYQWRIGDYLNYGQERFGKQVVKAFKLGRLTGWTLNDYAAVARKIPQQLRVPHLTWHHHRAVAKFFQLERQYWLNVAVEGRLSVRKLRERFREYIEGEAPNIKRGRYGRRLTRKRIFTDVDFFLRSEPWDEDFKRFAFGLPPEELDAWEEHLEPFYRLWVYVTARRWELKKGLNNSDRPRDPGQSPPKTHNGFVTNPWGRPLAAPEQPAKPIHADIHAF